MPRIVLIVMLVIVLIGACTLASIGFPITPAAAVTNRYILNDVEGIQIVGVFEIRHVSTSEDALMVIKQMVDNETDREKKAVMQEQYDAMVMTKDMILVRFVFTDGSGRCNPADCGFIVYYPSMTTDDYNCGVPTTARINAAILIPTIPAMESGIKTKITYFHNIRMVGSNNCEVGPAFSFETEDHSFNLLTDVLGQARDVIEAVPQCTLGVFSGGNYSETDCFAAQYYTQQTLIGIGPVPNEGQASIFFVAQTNAGLTLYNANDIATMLRDDPYASTLMTNISIFFQDAAVISPENLEMIEISMRAAEANIDFGQ